MAWVNSKHSDKTWVEGNGYSLVETHNVELDTLNCFLWINHEAVMRRIDKVKIHKPFNPKCYQHWLPALDRTHF
jgi:hypothetical protein